MGRGKNHIKTKEFYIFHDIHFMTFDSHLHTLQSSHTAKVKQSLSCTAHFPCDSRPKSLRYSMYRLDRL